MIPAPHTILRSGVYLLLVAISLLVLAPPGAFAHGEGACEEFHQNRAVLAADLQSRRFILEAKGKPEPAPPFRYAPERLLYHRTFSLSLDVADHVSLFNCDRSATCLMARDRTRPHPLKIPVFFVGSLGESLDDLEYYAVRAAFAPSESLNGGDNFTDVQFRLRRSGSRFSDIRPFFRCGLPGVMLCEGTCPNETLPLAASLINWAIKGEPKQPVHKTETATQPQAQQSPESQPKPSAPVKPDKAPAPALQEAPAKPETGAPANPVTPLPIAPPVTAEKPPIPPPVTQTEAPTEKPVSPPEPPPQLPAGHRLMLSFVRKEGGELKAAEVLQAEVGIKFEGVPLALVDDRLVADLPDAAFQKAIDGEALKTIWRHHSFISMIAREGQFVVMLEPLYIRAEQLAIKIQDASGEFVRGCDLALDVFRQRRLGSGWPKIVAQDRKRGLLFSEADGEYQLDLPQEVEDYELLISTAEPGDAAQLSNAAGGCELEARPLVTAEELRGLTISRSLSQTGPVLLTLLSTDSDFAALSPALADGFWTSALDLAAAISKQPYERKILARAQAPGVSAETKILQYIRDGSLLAQQDTGRSRVLKILSEGSRINAPPLSIIQFKPLERFHLDIALKTIRAQAEITPQQSVGHESLLMISGSVKTTGSDFCRRAVRGDAPSARPQWLKQVKKAFVLEVWSKASTEAMQKEQRAEAAEGAPEGIFRCKIGGADGERISLYALEAASISEDGAMARAFSYLTAQAESYLKP
jgi:hypothetical protein